MHARIEADPRVLVWGLEHPPAHAVEPRTLTLPDSSAQAGAKRHDSLWNGVLIGGLVGIPAAHLGEGLDGGDRVRAAVGGAVLGAVIGLMIDAARTN